MNETSIHSLITLLDDPSVDVFQPVADELMQKGTPIIPHLEEAWEHSYNELFQERIENIIQQIQFKSTSEKLKNWFDSGAHNLLEGVFYIAQTQYPELDYAEIDKKIELFTKDVWLEINNNLTALEKTKIINHILFDFHKLNRNTTNYYAPQNNYINQVLETKKGNPIMLSIIYMEVAGRLGLPIYGINLPKNFILAYVDEYREYMQQISANDVLFYINPFNKGAVLGKKEIDFFIKNQHLTPNSSCYTPCSNKDIVLRLLNNIVFSYENDENADDKSNQLKELLHLLSNRV